MPPRISDEEREQAVQYLIENVPEGTLMRIFEEIYKKPDALIAQHFGLGMSIRNLLRAGGFEWSDTVLDREWEPIMFEAVRRNYVGLS